MRTKDQSSRLRRILRRLLWAILLLFAIGVIAVAIWLRHGLYNRFVTFPRQEAAWAAIRAGRHSPRDPAPQNGWTEYRGILHSHSKLSHDSEVPFENILEVLKTTGVDFICLSDHCNDSQADFSAQWRGLHDGKLFIPGFEMKEGIMPFGVASNVVLSSRTDSALLARQVIENGGVLFYAHPEEPRDWDQPELTGMEIYNIHADFKTGGMTLGKLLPQVIVNQRRYPDQVFRLIFHRPTAILDHWDELNRKRHITGIAGNDCHQNTGFRAIVTESNTVRLEDTSPRKLKEWKLTWWNRPFARLFFGPLVPKRQLFHFQLDPYERMASFVNTHVLAKELSEPAVLDALRAGRAFVGFDMIADSSGFRWLATNGTSRADAGEAFVLTSDTRLQALSPCRCRFTILKDGIRVAREEGYSLEWNPRFPGKYRIEAELKVVDEWVPWVYANPIELR